MCFAPQRRALFRHLNLQKWCEAEVFCTFSLLNVLRATTACTFSTSQLPKVVRAWCVLYIFTSKCASRHNGVHFFDIATSKSGPTIVCFVLFCTFWLGNVLRATTACTFSTAQLPKVLRTWRVLNLFSPKSASRHNDVQFFISHLARWLRTRRFLLFDPPEPQIIGKTKRFATFLPFRTPGSSSDSFSSLVFSLLIFLFSLPLPCSAFHLSILSEVWLLNFLRLSSSCVLAYYGGCPRGRNRSCHFGLKCRDSSGTALFPFLPPARPKGTPAFVGEWLCIWWWALSRPRSPWKLRESIT